MIGLVVVSHGRLAEEFIAAAEHVVGRLEAVKAVCIGPEDDMDVRRKEIIAAAKACDQGDGVVILTDMFGGTPSNLGLSFLEAGKVEVVTGVNLPMLIKLAKARPRTDLAVLSRELCEHGRTAIRMASDLLRAAGDAEPKG